MKKKIIVKENGVAVKKIEITIRDYEHLQAQIKNPHRIARNKKKYNRKYQKGIDNDYQI